MKLFTLLTLSSLLFGCAGEKSDSPRTDLRPTTQETENSTKAPTIVEELQTELKKIKQAPSLTVILVIKEDVQKSVALIKSRGGKIVYDPNNGMSSSIPFIIADLTPELINDSAFMGSLKLKAASIDSQRSEKTIIQNKENLLSEDFSDFIPTASVKVDALGERSTLGKGVTVAVIDTGIDASHPAFGNRVVYWYDGTQETRTKLVKLEKNEGIVSISDNKIALPGILKDFDGELYGAVMDEKAFTSQLSSDERYNKGYLDLNYNNSADKFTVIVAKKGTQESIFFDANANSNFEANESEGLIDYNMTAFDNRADGMVRFPSRNNIISYPILMEEEGDSLYINLGRPEGSHGTHVAGIIAANEPSKKLLGAAPEANLMSLRVCSGISCTDSAIIKGLYKAFYNGKVIPDVVNISLGSHEQAKRGLYSYLLNDLSAKFGTIFFISASNSGPGFRTLNHFGNSGAVVMVGANVSQATLEDQYNLPAGAAVNEENLLFFSSLGPSYTGEMKPNLVAPGAAIASIPAVGGYMSQMNGTSMSSPLAAGAFAAVLGELKKEIPDEFKTIETMRTLNLGGEVRASETLLPYVYLMRDALMRGAKELPNLTRAQQGFGLLQADKTYDILLEDLESLNKKAIDYHEVVINGYSSSYDRTGKPVPVQSYQLTIGEDGERTKSSLAKIIAAGVDVELSRVEILDSFGKMTVLGEGEDTKYFSIVQRGNSESREVFTHITYNNSRNNLFYSRRHFEMMETGKTYLAHYKVSSNGVNLTNIIDVVHMPYKLEINRISLPTISPAKTVIENGFAISKTKISANDFHRYPIYVDEKTMELNIQVAISAGQEGRVFVQLYNPKGEEVEFTAAQNSPVTSYLSSSTKTKTTEKGKVLTGVWELTVSTASSTWLADTEYEVLVEGSSFGSSKKSIELKADKETQFAIKTDDSKLTHVLIQNLQKVESKKVKVKSNYTSFYPLGLSTDYRGVVTLKTAQNENSAFWGNIRPKLYVKQGDDFIELKTNNAHIKNSNSFSVTGDLSKAYFALDTITNYTDTEKNQSTVEASVQIEVITKAATKLDLTTNIKNFADLDGAIVTFKNKTAIEAKYRATVSFISGDLNFVTDIFGQRTLVLNAKNKVFSVEMNIE